MTRGTLGSAGIAALVVLVTGCGSSGTPAPAASAGSASPSTSSSATPTATSTSAATSTPQADPADPIAQNLCDQIKPQLSDWDVQGPSLGGTALNITVHQWALGHGGLAMSARVLADKAMIDRLTIKTCPDVRAEALRDLNLPNFAAGIMF